MAATNAQRLAHYHRKRRLIIELLGGVCTCCQEAEYEFLQIDHIHNDGAEHRRRLNSHGGTALLADMFARPERYQILCANCHLAKSKGKVCPHKR